MSRQILSLVRQYLFWMFFFFLLRAMFLVYNIPLLRADNIPWTEAIAAFWHAFYLDTATTCYILLVPFLFITLQGFIAHPFLDRLTRIYTLLFIVISSLIAIAELAIYSEWKTKLTSKALAYLKRPAEVYESISAVKFFGFLLVVALLSMAGYFLYKKIFFMPVRKRSGKLVYTVVFFLMAGATLFIGLRGGVRPIPITLGVSHYSYHSILNWAAVNSNYNLAVSYIEAERYDETNPFDFYSLEEAREVVEGLRDVEKDTTMSIIGQRLPNIVILLMESWSADLIQSLGGEPGITPEFHALEKEGLLFTHLYASGNRSQQGLASILGGFPAIPYTTLTENPDKFQQLPSLTRILSEQGYHTSFYFGGDLDYGNIRSYLLFNGIQDIIEEKDIPDSIPRGRLGIHDEFMMDLHAVSLASFREPYFSVLFTLSSHSPYDQPREQWIPWDGPEGQYVGSAHYSDYCLGEYFRKVKATGNYDNTLFIIIADHSHNTYRNWPLESFQYRRIPMMFLGGALREEFHGEQVDRISTNVDLPVTLLQQMGVNSDAFPWSRDLFNPLSPEYAYFEINDGLGWKNTGGEFVFNTRSGTYLKIGMHEDATPEDQDRMIREGKSFFQVLFQEFLDM